MSRAINHLGRGALAALALAVGARTGTAQAIGARIAPQFYSYTIDDPSNLKISEFAVPIYVVVPVNQRLSFDIGTAYARSRVTQEGATTSESTISGFTDTQIRGNLTLGTDLVVLTAGVNLPTGTSTVGEDEAAAAGLIGSDFLALPISSMGTGFGATGGVVIAHPAGAWNLGAGLSVRHSASYDPFDPTGGAVAHYRPGNEYRARIGADHPVGTGRVTLGFTYSTFGDDDLAGSIYNTGNRYLTQVDFDNSLGAGRIAISAWNLFRTRGTLADGSLLDHENISNGSVSYGFPAGSATIEPTIEGRSWTQVGASTSYLGTLGVHAQFSVAGLAVVPGAGYSFGRVAAASSTTPTATLSGYRATLTIRAR